MWAADGIWRRQFLVGSFGYIQRLARRRVRFMSYGTMSVPLRREKEVSELISLLGLLLPTT